MHHLSVKSKLVDTNTKGNKNVESRGHENPICPKPRRLRSSLPAQFLNHPSLCTKLQQINADGRSGILDVIGEKRIEEEELCGCNRCSWCGSPPARTDNPLIHDLHFLQFHSTPIPPFTPT